MFGANRTNASGHPAVCFKCPGCCRFAIPFISGCFRCKRTWYQPPNPTKSRQHKILATFCKRGPAREHPQTPLKQGDLAQDPREKNLTLGSCMRTSAEVLSRREREQELPRKGSWGKKVPGYLSILGATNSTQEPLFQWYKYSSKYPSRYPLSQDLSAQDLPSSQELQSPDLSSQGFPSQGTNPWQETRVSTFPTQLLLALLAPSFPNPSPPICSHSVWLAKSIRTSWRAHQNAPMDCGFSYEYTSKFKALETKGLFDSNIKTVYFGVNWPIHVWIRLKTGFQKNKKYPVSPSISPRRRPNQILSLAIPIPHPQPIPTPPIPGPCDFPGGLLPAQSSRPCAPSRCVAPGPPQLPAAAGRSRRPHIADGLPSGNGWHSELERSTIFTG